MKYMGYRYGHLTCYYAMVSSREQNLDHHGNGRNIKNELLQTRKHDGEISNE